jgi:hypothetical protein
MMSWRRSLRVLFCKKLIRAIHNSRHYKELKKDALEKAIIVNSNK